MSDFWRREPFFTLDQAALLLAEVDPWDFDNSASTPRPMPLPVTHDIAYRVSKEAGNTAKQNWASLIRAAQFGRITPWKGKVTDRVESDAEPFIIPSDRIDPDSCEFVTFDIERDELARWWKDEHDTLPYFLGGDHEAVNPSAAPKPSHFKLIAWMLEELMDTERYQNQNQVTAVLEERKISGLTESNVQKILAQANRVWQNGNHNRSH